MTERGASILGAAVPSVKGNEAGTLGPSPAGAGQQRGITRPPSAGPVIFWLIVATMAVAAAAMYFGSSGYPVFGLGLAFGFAVGAVPYGLLVLVHAGASEVVTPRTRRRRRMTEEEWQRIFGPRSSGPGAWTAHAGGDAGDGPRTATSPLSEERMAYERLELEPGATMRQITRAYHRLAHQYHPDVTVGRAAAERELAEERMKQLNAAYALLRRQYAHAAGRA